MFLHSFDQTLIDEFLDLKNINTSGNLLHPCKNYGKFELLVKDSTECKTQFHFEWNGIH